MKDGFRDANPEEGELVLQAGLAPRAKPGTRTPGEPLWLAHRVFKVGSGAWQQATLDPQEDQGDLGDLWESTLIHLIHGFHSSI
jgi:hypothetical protein